ncbi:hypothetical protein QA089_002391 [Meyerozyma guilliermondii]
MLTTAFSLVIHLTFKPVKSPESTALFTKSRFASGRNSIIIPCSNNGSSSTSGASESYPSPGTRVGFTLTLGTVRGFDIPLSNSSVDGLCFLEDRLSLSFLLSFLIGFFIPLFDGGLILILGAGSSDLSSCRPGEEATLSLSLRGITVVLTAHTNFQVVLWCWDVFGEME